GIVRVRDQGPGIPAADRERIFERFTRGSAGGSVPGSGIGLFLSNELAARMGGRLFLEETSSAGSVFAIELPLAGGALGIDGARPVRPRRPRLRRCEPAPAPSGRR